MKMLPEQGDDNGVIWPAFGDLMACLFGLFVLFFVWLATVQVGLSQDLAEERAQREAATKRLEVLESALAGPLAAGLLTLVDGRIGIQASVLFEPASADLADEGETLLRSLGAPLRAYLEEKDESVMVSGFTDDVPLTGWGEYKDNWELSAQRALTVTRALIDAGLPPDWVFSAGFGPNHPVTDNDTAEHRAQNRRVEIRPVPRPETIAEKLAP